MAETFLVYGPTGSGKTSLAIGMAKWVYERTGKLTRVITSDPGGVSPIRREGLTKAGIVSTYNMAGDDPKLLWKWRKLSKGWWKGVTTEMVAPKDSDGVPIGAPEPVKTITLVENQAALAKVGFYYIEGATSTSDGLMRHLVKQEVIADDGKVSAIGPQGSSGRYEEDGEVLGGNSKGHYNITQVEMHGLFTAFSALPDDILAGWSAHEGTGLIKRTGESCYCPALAGGAKNHLVPTWVGDCFHLADYPEHRDEYGQIQRAKEVRAYFTSHFDADSEIPYKCKSRCGLSDVAALEERFPGGYVPIGTGPEQGLDQYFRWLEGRKGSNLSGLLKWKAEMDKMRSSH